MWQRLEWVLWALVISGVCAIGYFGIAMVQQMREARAIVVETVAKTVVQSATKAMAETAAKKVVEELANFPRKEGRVHTSFAAKVASWEHVAVIGFTVKSGEMPSQEFVEVLVERMLGLCHTQQLTPGELLLDRGDLFGLGGDITMYLELTFREESHFDPEKWEQLIDLSDEDIEVSVIAVLEGVKK